MSSTEQMQRTQDITIIYNKFCPFAQRALITALEKEVPATFQKVSLGEKSGFFRETYRKAMGRDPKSEGKVPILIHQNRIITESEPVCWYLAQSFTTGSSLIPADPYQRAKMRIMISNECSDLIQLFNKPKLKLVTNIKDYQEELKQVLSSINKLIEGDFFLGSQISLIDIMIYPWFERWIIIEHYFEVQISNEYKQIKSWLKRMNERKSIVETKKLTNSEYYISRSEKMMTAKL